jgi:hypothetical protein
MARKPPPVAKPVAPPAAGAEAGIDPIDLPIDLPERGPGTTDAAAPVRVQVTVNTLITRADLGPGRFTFVAALDMIPIGLEGLPRAPA